MVVVVVVLVAPDRILLIRLMRPEYISDNAININRLRPRGEYWIPRQMIKTSVGGVG